MKRIFNILMFLVPIQFLVLNAEKEFYKGRSLRNKGEFEKLVEKIKERKEEIRLKKLEMIKKCLSKSKGQKITQNKIDEIINCLKGLIRKSKDQRQDIRLEKKLEILRKCLNYSKDKQLNQNDIDEIISCYEKEIAKLHKEVKGKIEKLGREKFRKEKHKHKRKEI